MVYKKYRREMLSHLFLFAEKNYSSLFVFLYREDQISHSYCHRIVIF